MILSVMKIQFITLPQATEVINMYYIILLLQSHKYY